MVVRSGTLERFAAKVAVDQASGCWRRPAGADDHGYGQFWFEGKMVRSHRASYLMFVGPIPDRFEVDHVKTRGCRYRDCVRPTHLEAVTPRENTMRADGVASAHARVEKCPQDHEYTADNTYWVGKPGKKRRQCKKCTKASAAARHERLKNDPTYREQRRVGQLNRRRRAA